MAMLALLATGPVGTPHEKVLTSWHEPGAVADIANCDKKHSVQQAWEQDTCHPLSRVIADGPPHWGMAGEYGLHVKCQGARVFVRHYRHKHCEGVPFFEGEGETSPESPFCVAFSDANAITTHKGVSTVEDKAIAAAATVFMAGAFSFVCPDAHPHAHTAAEPVIADVAVGLANAVGEAAGEAAGEAVREDITPGPIAHATAAAAAAAVGLTMAEKEVAKSGATDVASRLGERTGPMTIAEMEANRTPVPVSGTPVTTPATAKRVTAPKPAGSPVGGATPVTTPAARPPTAVETVAPKVVTGPAEVVDVHSKSTTSEVTTEGSDENTNERTGVITNIVNRVRDRKGDRLL